MTATFTLVVVDETHMILATERTLTREEQRGIIEGFAAWRANGGVAVIGECVIRNREAVQIELDVPEPSPAEVRHERLLEGLPVGGDGITDEAADEFVRSHGGR